MAEIEDKVIKYSATFQFAGDPYTLVGTARLSRKGKRLKINEAISSGGSTIVFRLRSQAQGRKIVAANIALDGGRDSFMRFG
ncbi:MAG: hypothetical protein PHC88_08755 [Terrimicrobiaceae bacterium]|nr:hypothetical protein [Terrimicrobiaceae bacterium]